MPLPHTPLTPGRVEAASGEAPSSVPMESAVPETTGWGRSGLWPAVRKWTLCAERGKRGSCCSLRPPSQHHEKDAPRRCRYHALSLPRPGRQRRANQLCWVLVLPPRRRWSHWRQVPLSPLAARTGRTGLPKTRYLDPGSTTGRKHPESLEIWLHRGNDGARAVEAGQSSSIAPC